MHLFQETTLFEETLKRIKEIKEFKDPIIITSIKYGFLIKQTMKKIKLQCNCYFRTNTQKHYCFNIPSSTFAKKYENLFIIPSDHYFQNITEFKNIIKKISTIKHDEWTIFGVKATAPLTNYGYIKIKDDLNINDKNFYNKIYEVEKFVEKPNLKEATNLLETGCYFWNLGIFYANAEILLESINQFSPKTAKFCELSLKIHPFYQNITKLNWMRLNSKKFLAIQ